MIDVKILTTGEVNRYLDNLPDITFSQEFINFQREKHGMQSEFLGIFDKNSLACFFPINYAKARAFSVYKSYTTPYFVKNDFIVDWQDVARSVKKKYMFDAVELNFYFINDYNRTAHLKASNSSCSILQTGEGESRETLLEKFNKKTRNEIRKSETNNFNIKIGGAEEIDNIFKLYLENMQRHGTPARSKDYFIKLFQCYGNYCRALMVYDDNKLIGLNLFLFKKQYLRLIFNLSKIEYWRKCVNNFIFFKMIEWGHKEGVRIFDYGPSLNTDKSHGHFKQGFGAKQIPIFKIFQGSKRIVLQKWLSQKRFSLKIKLKKYFNINFKR